MSRTISSTTALPLRSPRRSIEALGSEALGVSPSPLVSWERPSPADRISSPSCWLIQLAEHVGSRIPVNPKHLFFMISVKGTFFNETSFDIDGQQVQELNGI
ncbi:hypothetical protein OUZ56_025548 [Daphnia magna]|uniref:Uncharacterized protein n=1 Tax=Daphnia magna TaxID=35525 RepID=A0ABQ9ZLK2_9CRUS|nr:hypothetical protein OUZ56_025548 [Daphnia magna]